MEEGDGVSRRGFLTALGIGLGAIFFPNIAFGKKGHLPGDLQYARHKDDIALQVKVRRNESYTSIAFLYTGAEQNANKIKSFNDNKNLHPRDLIYIQKSLLRNLIKQVFDENNFSVFEIAGQGESGINNLWELIHSFMVDSYSFEEKKATLLILNPEINPIKDVVFDGQEILVPTSLIKLELVEEKSIPEREYPPVAITQKKARQNPFRTDIDHIKKRLRPRDLFGAERIRGLGRGRYRVDKHTGLDLVAKIGTPLYPIENSTLISAGRDYSKWRNGIKVVYKTNSGLIITYLHLKSANGKIKVGKPITTDTVLGYVGITGNASADNPHVHVQVVLSGNIVDPKPYVVV